MLVHGDAQTRRQFDRQQIGSLLDAQFSMPYTLAVAAESGRVTIEQYQPLRLHEPEIGRLMAATQVLPDRELGPAESPPLELRLADGRRLERQIEFAKGAPQNPITDIELQEKVKSLITPVLGEERCRQIVAAVDGLDELTDCRGLLDCLPAGNSSRKPPSDAALPPRETGLGVADRRHDRGDQLPDHPDRARRSLQALVGDFPAPPDYIAQVRHQFGLDASIPEQLWGYAAKVAHGNLGFSFANRQPVVEHVLARARLTLLLMVPALTTASMLGVVLAVSAARRAGSATTGITALSLFGYSVPIFWLGQLMVMLFAVGSVAAAAGMISLRTSLTDGPRSASIAWHMVLPGLQHHHLLRRRRSAHRPGQRSHGAVGGLHPDRDGEGPVASGSCLAARAAERDHPGGDCDRLQFRLFSPTGAIFVETVFAWPGLGNLFIASVTNRDYPVLQGILLVSAFMVVLVNLATDMLLCRAGPTHPLWLRTSPCIASPAGSRSSVQVWWPGCSCCCLSSSVSRCRWWGLAMRNAFPMTYCWHPRGHICWVPTNSAVMCL